ncbi:hypothetical protein FT663_04672 [Candidozyma haemuli var. vulneris]|uniref:Uncharacterized protein n=1 Tax=Candidozyma haemuli TaxID=45357 RepID=A0A2V1AZY9_9ASCO|nr:hypothetical protein CXQ85_003917 [[Candida] haemuloni]KAF3986945.1 hypothetical protein FT663_04672 [[Candida] haemuloni var. vulneris]KAF3989105.1 hypothetical protein FT662_03001 [[Candida] haemuloni var. vulneris]PVH23627.1 hypothetical protein CXQ85_003917 [[Candida] haemuloni]
MTSICALCLGDDTEIPSFGTTKDAEDLIMPCSTCSLVVHKMCLMEWFNSLPPSKVTRTFRDETQGVNRRARAPTPTNSDNGSDNGNRRNGDVGVFPPVDEDDLDDQGMFNFNSRWGSLLVQFGTESYVYTPSSEMVGLGDNTSIMLSTDCPQCKNKIVFKMSHSSLLALNSLVRSSIKDMVSYSGVFMGVSGAAIGIVTVGYAGLTRCGVNMLEVMIPESILVSLLRKKTPPAPGSSLSTAVPSADRMEWDINVLSHFRFQLVPLLPLVLFRMRFSSIFGCIFNTSASSMLTDVFNEFLVCQYVSSLGNHMLAKSLYANVKQGLVSAWRSRSLGLLGWTGLTKGINWWDPNIMIGSMVPARWLYDLLFRLTVNKRHFDLSMAVRPKSIANSLSESELARYETIENRLGKLHFELRDKVRKAKRNSNFVGSTSPVITALKHKLLTSSLIFKDDFAWRWIKLKVQSWSFKSLACLKNDYSSSLLVNSRVVTGVTTFLWPFLAADVGRIILTMLSRSSWFQHVPKTKLILLANLIGMFGVTFLKDMFNLYLSAHKAGHLSNMTIVTSRERRPSTTTSPTPTQTASVPGAFNQ